jgi:hypothetical protein
MSPSRNTLTVSTSPLAEISVLDGSMNTVAQSVGELTKELSPGLYKVRVRNGPALVEELVSLDKDRSIDVRTPPIFSPIPLEGTTRTHEYHMAHAAIASRNPAVDLGQGSGLFVFCREWSADGTGASLNPATGLSIIDERGNQLSDLGQTADVNRFGDPSAAWCASVGPGAYRLRLTSPNGVVTERALFASPNLQTQIFVLLTPEGSTANSAALPDIAGGAVVISPTYSFNPQDRRTELGEIARYALTQKRRILTDGLRREIVNVKFEDPMLGLLGAHLVLRDEPENSALFDAVTRNLLMVLGRDHPDLRVLCLRRNTPIPEVPRALDTPPMLRASWDLAVAASLEDPNAFPETGGVLEIAQRIAPTGSWLVWRREPSEESTNASRVGVSSALAQSLEGYIAAKVRLEGARLASNQSVLGHVASAVRNVISSGINRLRGKTEPSKLKLPSLNADDRAELSRVLGIPAPLLNSILGKIFEK